MEIPSPDSVDPPADLLPDLDSLEAAMKAGFYNILKELGDKWALDKFKEDQIARLHEELQAYKTDLVYQSARQLLLGLIRLHDDLGKMIASLRQRPADELTPERFFQHFSDFQDDIELLLGQHGVERFEVGEEEFDPCRQTVLRTVSTSEPGKIGRVAERLRPGFERGEALLQKERVAVYVGMICGDKI
jgi:molecular chaperone GrpE (heat shock protein)